jgi:cation diffusion facilitator CzcD-associated flavoprotein CzcO
MASKTGTLPSMPWPEDFTHVKKVAIIGSGVAGLQTARALEKIGKDCVIFERSDNVGGVWRSNYDNFGLQVPKELYEFAEYPWPSNVKQGYYPTGPETQAYIEGYARHFGLDRRIRFNTSIHNISKTSEASPFQLRFGKDEVEDFDFVVVATGMYSSNPHIPKVPGQSEFQGEVYHSCTFTDASVCEGKKVLVVGGGKSAIDNAVSGAKHGEKSTLLYRSAHWPVPRHLCNLVPFKWGTYSRFGHFMLKPHHDASSFAQCMHSLFTPVKWIWWRVVEQMFKLQFRLPKEMIPDAPIEVDVFSGGQILNYEFRDMLKAGKVNAKKGSLQRMTPTGAVLQDGTEVEADVLVFGTGFGKNYELLESNLRERLDLERDGLYLYRNVLPARLPGLAFVGSEVSTFNNILTQGLQAEWLARVLQGDMKLPQGKLSQAVESEQAWKRSWMPATSARASILQLHMMKYHDMLLRDMGEDHKRKGWNVLAEVFAPYNARDYTAVFEQEEATNNVPEMQLNAA